SVRESPDGASRLARAFESFVLGLGGWPLSDERRITAAELPGVLARGEPLAYIAHEPNDDSSAAIKSRILAELDDVLDCIKAFYAEMDSQLHGIDHDEPIPDWEDWTLKLRNLLRPFFHRWDKAEGRFPPERRHRLSNEALLDVPLVVAEPELLVVARLGV